MLRIVDSGAIVNTAIAPRKNGINIVRINLYLIIPYSIRMHNRFLLVVSIRHRSMLLSPPLFAPLLVFMGLVYCYSDGTTVRRIGS